MSRNHALAPAPNEPLGLQWYDAACDALAKARAVDEVKDIRDRAVALAAYARQAKDTQIEVDALAIRARAERRVGELITEQRETVGLAEGVKGTAGPGRGNVGPMATRVSEKPTLAEAGIDKHLADRARKLAAMPEAQFEEHVKAKQEKVRSRGAKPVKAKTLKVVKTSKPPLRSQPSREVQRVGVGGDQSFARAVRAKIFQRIQPVLGQALTLGEFADKWGVETAIPRHRHERARALLREALIVGDVTVDDHERYTVTLQPLPRALRNIYSETLRRRKDECGDSLDQIAKRADADNINAPKQTALIEWVQAELAKLVHPILTPEITALHAEILRRRKEAKDGWEQTRWRHYSGVVTHQLSLLDYIQGELAKLVD